ncbi:RTX-I toxin determinant A from serotypes 1/9 [Shimia sp. SK013]|uniref:calcium-binding protein n=1 Tax=Shimia sp. SK013 TaxID=1389006 RepID=UPI0006CC80C3|nr:calcium-binding protein [Shimia sp. SK013]KPA22249.1 RTX-I toxin determinant A from serotypes 1/9 [Shimia sp. SK013]
MTTTVTLDTSTAPIEVQEDMFGTNILADTNETGGTPHDEFIEAADMLGASHLRYPGGRAEGEDITQLDTTAQGFDQLDGDLRAFLDWAKDTGTSATLVVAALNDTHANPAELEAWAELVLTYMGEDADLIKAYEVGNEFWQTIDESTYGSNASIITEALSGVTVDGVRPDIYIQTANVTGGQSNYKGTSGGSISDEDALAAMQHWDASFRPSDWEDGQSAEDYYNSLNDYEQRIIKGNLELMQQLDADGDLSNGFQFDSTNGFDGIVAHYYMNDWTDGFDLSEDATRMEVRNLDLRFSVWEGIIPNDIELRVTEWNVDTDNYSSQGLRAAGTLIEQFSNMLELGVDGAELWTVRHNTNTSVAGAPGGANEVELTPAGMVLEHLSNLYQNAQGDLCLYSVGGFDATEMEINVYGDNYSRVVYVMSRSDEFGEEFSLDLSGVAGGSTHWSAVTFGIDPTSSDGLSEQRVYDEDGILVSRNPKREVTEAERDALIAKLGDAYSNGMIKLVNGAWMTYLPDADDILVRPGVTNPTALEDFYFPTESDVVGLDTFFDMSDLGQSVTDISFDLDPYEVIAITFDVAFEQSGGDTSDYIAGGDGRDIIRGNGGADTIRSREGDDTLHGHAGDDNLVGGLGNDELNGGGGRDRLEGEGGEDVLLGHNGRDTLYGGNGGDTLYGGNGADSLDGGSGNDSLYGDLGADHISGGTGSDRLSGGNNRDSLYGGHGHDTLFGGNGNDRLYGDAGDDALIGNTGSDRLSGGNGSDILDGGDGDDMLFGGNGFDLLEGGVGDDVLAGQVGNDTLTGGVGADIFEFRTGDGLDVITDFNGGEGDQISFRDITDIADFDDLISNHLIQSGNNTVIWIDDNHNITLVNTDLADLTAEHFLF